MSRYTACISEFGVYLHFPWCRKRCPYCDFAIEVGLPPHDTYLEAITRELDLRASRFTGELVSIYLGGGTPSLWRPDCIAAAIERIRQRFADAPVHPDAQASIEPTGAGPRDPTRGRGNGPVWPGQTGETVGGVTPEFQAGSVLPGAGPRDATRGGGNRLALLAERRRESPLSIEVTLEANPTDCHAENLAAWRAAGVNRISIGVQSLSPRELVVLGRDHRFGDGRAAVERTIAAGFTTSADFIIGVPGGSAARGGPAGVPAVEIPADHLSIYELTIEPRTAFGRRVRDGRLMPLPEDALAELYIAMHDRLTTAGYEHYEISSYARPGKRAVHNALYWRGAAYLGLGVGAASLELCADGSGRRVTNPRRAADYLANPGTPMEVIASTRAELAADRAWLGLRTSDGVAEADLAAAPGLADFLVTERFAERRAGRICPTLGGFLMADRIAARVVESWSAKELEC